MKRTLLISIAVMFLTATGWAQDSVFVRQNYVKHEYQIPMRDGVKLFTIAYVPKEMTEKHPILMTRTPYSVGPYGPDNYYRYLSNLTRKYFERNYIMVFQDVRGRYMSEGEYVDVRPYIPNKKGNKDIDETSDTYDTVDWLVKNIPNNNGNVGVRGISYPGFYSSMASIDAHPAVKAISPQAPVSQWMGGDDWFHNGAFLISHAFGFYARFGWPRGGPTTMHFHRFDFDTPDGYEYYLRLGALPNANRLFFHDSVEYWNTLMTHGTWDSFWQARDILPHLKNIRPATLIVGGWFDTENLYGALHSYQAIEKNSKGDHMIAMGPWAHGWWSSNNVDSLGYIKFGSNLSEFFADSLEVPFFDHYLRGIGNPHISEATVFLTGENQWEHLDAWPPKNGSYKKLYLQQNGGLSFVPPSDGKKEYDEYVSDPMKPVPYTNEIDHWYDASFMLQDQRFAGRRPDVLVYQSDILSEDVTIAGPIKVNLVGSTSGTDCDWIVKVIDVFPDDTATPRRTPAWVKLGGYEMMVRGDVLRGKFRNSTAKPEAISPDKPTTFAYDLQDVFHRFKKGHRIMIQVQSTWFPMIDRNPGTYMDIYSAKDSDFQKTTQRVYHSPKEASYLNVLVVP